MTAAYTVQGAFEGLKSTLHQYLEAQYHVWDESLIRERRRLFSIPGTTFQEPLLEATPYYVPGQHFSRLNIPAAAQRILTMAAAEQGTGIFSLPYLHQTQALEAVLARGEDVLVATGTGSGKTESFLMPILGSLAIEAADRPESWTQGGMRALLLYPMNALVNDQVARLRRLFGNRAVAAALRAGREQNCTFGMYTSRTPYPGSSNRTKDRERVGELLERLFGGITPQARELLEREGKWPCKDIEAFIANSFRTSPDDSELFTRQEMQARCPDLLVTNYSMLEYMMLRPIERTIFEETSRWLHADDRNKLTIVVDEAHMYRGSGGAEVAYLLRRLHGRLGVAREKLQYILTSASLGDSREAETHILKFASELTGLRDDQSRFTLIRGRKIEKANARPGTSRVAELLSAFDLNALQSASVDLVTAAQAIAALKRDLAGRDGNVPQDIDGMRASVYEMLEGLPVAASLANEITSRPNSLGELAQKLFPNSSQRIPATEALLGLVTFARDRDDGRVFAPVRTHLFFRGVPGLYSCVSSACDRRAHGDNPLLGRMYSSPQLQCDCGSRVYEVLTHRDCGAAFIRAFLNDEDGDFAWHERSSGLWREGGLMEAHLLVESARVRNRGNRAPRGTRAWLHKASGRLLATLPNGAIASEFLEVIRPDTVVNESGRNYLTFQNECPVCLRTWQGMSKIMDLATKGEAPFSHLIRQQVALQPATKPKTEQFPNAGRKSLIFSDGRQKAARLARDIPREIEKDVFRQLLMLATTRLASVWGEGSLSPSLYVAFVDAVQSIGLQLFDGDDRHALARHVREYREWHDSDLRSALRDWRPTPPARYTEHLLRQLGSRFYSLSALTLGYVRPNDTAMRVLRTAVPNLGDELLSAAVVWTQGMCEKFAFDVEIRHGVRQNAAGYPMGTPNARGFGVRQRDFLASRGFDVQAMEAAFQQSLCSQNPQGHPFINPSRVKIEPALDRDWIQCQACSSVSPMTWWGVCPNCQSDHVTRVSQGDSPYLRARKGFWRDPVAQVLAGAVQPINLCVEEHTAQLSHRDISEPTSTTEEFERRFRDILIRMEDTPVDVLSSTTTMEVGIDIGSLVAVALRNVPPLRQNYQQRAGRAGRRGSSVSTVVTFAQNSPHDSHYFVNPLKIVSGEPTLPSIDVQNTKIIERHIRAQLVEEFFRELGSAGGGSGNIYTTLGETWAFYTGDGDLTLGGLRAWLATPSAQSVFRRILEWIPSDCEVDPLVVANSFLLGLEADRPAHEEDIDQSSEFLIEFLFARGYLPAYAFPRDLCALQIEGDPPTEGFRRVPILQRPQQALNVALSEYAPGRLVVVDKRTYRVGSVTASGSSSSVDRAARLFQGQRTYVHCEDCMYTAGFSDPAMAMQSCPMCGAAALRAVTVIQPEVVFPDGGREVDEFDDEQVFGEVTSAQLPLTQHDVPIPWQAVLRNGQIAAVANQPLVMVNSGADSPTGPVGFRVCCLCGKTAMPGQALGSHTRDYRIQPTRGNAPPPRRCQGEFRQVYLGYSFSSDVLLFRIPVSGRLRYDPLQRRLRQPVSDALQSLCEAIVLAISRELDIDLREVSAGYRFVRSDDQYWADIFVHDTLAGGAGYAVLAGQSFGSILDKAFELVSACDCGSSCDKCLRHYGNRYHHPNLDRHLAADLIRFVRDGVVPSNVPTSEQRIVLEPMLQLLRLAGWSVERQEPLSVVSPGGRRLSLRIVHSLFSDDTETLADDGMATFTPYELQRDLPGAFAEIE